MRVGQVCRVGPAKSDILSEMWRWPSTFNRPIDKTDLPRSVCAVNS